MKSPLPWRSLKLTKQPRENANSQLPAADLQAGSESFCTPLEGKPPSRTGSRASSQASSRGGSDSSSGSDVMESQSRKSLWNFYPFKKKGLSLSDSESREKIFKTSPFGKQNSFLLDLIALSNSLDAIPWTRIAQLPDYRINDAAASYDMELEVAIKEIEKIARHSDVFYHFGRVKCRISPLPSFGVFEVDLNYANECVALSSYLKSINILRHGLRFVDTFSFWEDGIKKLNPRLNEMRALMGKRLYMTSERTESLKGHIPHWEKQIIPPDKLIYEYALEIIRAVPDVSLDPGSLYRTSIIMLKALQESALLRESNLTEVELRDIEKHTSSKTWIRLILDIQQIEQYIKEKPNVRAIVDKCTSLLWVTLIIGVDEDESPFSHPAVIGPAW